MGAAQGLGHLFKAWHEAQINGILVIVTNAYHSADFATNGGVRDGFTKRRPGLAALGKVKILSSLSDADMEALYRRADLVSASDAGRGLGPPHVPRPWRRARRSLPRTGPARRLIWMTRWVFRLLLHRS